MGSFPEREHDQKNLINKILVYVNSLKIDGAGEGEGGGGEDLFLKYN